MDSTLEFSVMPEALSTSDLVSLLRVKMPHAEVDLETMDRSDLIELAWRLGCFPKPQRVPRDNRRGEVLKLQYEREEMERTSNDIEISEQRSTKRDASSACANSSNAKRLKPAPCDATTSGDSVKAKKIQLRKPTATLTKDGAKSAVTKQESVARASLKAGVVENGKRSNEESRDEINLRRRKHSPVKFP